MRSSGSRRRWSASGTGRPRARGWRSAWRGWTPAAGSRTGPRGFWTRSGRSLPDGAWLTELRQASALVVLRGRAASLTSLSDFVSGLQRSASFAPPVEVVDSQIDDQGGAGDPIRFELHAALRDPGPARPTGPR